MSAAGSQRGGIVAFILVIAALAAACRGRSADAPESATGTDQPAQTAEEPAAPTEREIVLFFPGSSDEFLHGERRTVLPIGTPEDRAKQCLEELIRGPNPPFLAAIPDKVRLRQVYLLADGTAFADFSGEMLAHRGGTLGELQTIYAIVDTLVVNVPEIRRVGILVDGKSRETLAGHVDIELPLPPDYQYVDPRSRPAKAAEHAVGGVGGPSEPVPPSGEGDASKAGGGGRGAGGGGDTKGDGDGT